MIIHKDFRELLQLLEEKNVDYLIVGAYALAYYGYVRNTKDIDVFYRLDVENVRKLKAAMLDYGFAREALESTTSTQ